MSLRVCLAIFAALQLILPFSCLQAIASATPAAKLLPCPGKGAVISAAAEPRLQPLLFNTTDRSFVNKWLSPGQYMPVSEIKPGMTGWGLTVFQGTKVEKFNVQIIGVVKKVLNGRDAILARLSGGAMNKNNVIKGMSGSPVYVNGKLIGAVSFGYDFSKEPIAGITPIVDMLDALADNTQPRGSIAHLSAPSWSIPAQESGIANVSSGALHMVPLVSPVSLCGFSPRAETFLSQRFKDIGMQVTSGSAGAMDAQLDKAASQQIQPGGAVSVLLATGDFTVVATGTATARFGGKVVAFGHPFLQAGAIDFPMATAYVHQILPSLSVSFKVASPVAVVGSFTADRPWACGGQIGHCAKLIPASYTVIDETRHIQRTYNCQVIDHPDLTPELLSATATSAIDATHQAAGPYVVRVESRIEAEGIDPIVRTDRFSTNLSPHSLADLFGMGGDPVGRYVHRATSQIVNNDFQKASIKSVKLNIVLEDGHQTAKLDRVYIDKPYAAPGEEVKVTCVLKPYNKEPVEETLSIQIPRDAPDGNMLIGVAGGQEVDFIKGRIGVTDPEPETLKQIAQNIVDDGRGDQISLLVALPQQGLMLNGTRLVDPPAHWARVFFSNRHTKGPTLVRGDMRTTRTSNWLLSGSHILTVEVRSPDKAAARLAPLPISAPSSHDDVSITEQARKTMESIPARKASGFGSRAGQSGSSNTLQGGVTSSSSGSSSSSSSSSSNKTSSTPASSIMAAPGKDYPHMRPAMIWRQETEEEFRAGKTDDTTVDSWGRISPGFESLAEKPVSSEDQIWSGVFASGYFYYSSGGDIWRWKGDDSKPELAAKLGGILIPSMVSDSRGTIYAASVPGGQVFAIDSKSPSLHPQVVFRTSEQIITSVCTDDHDDLYVGTSSTGRIYKVSAGNDMPRKSSLLFDSGQAHILSMFFCRSDHNLYVGTGERGSVYRLTPSGSATAVYQSPDHFVTGVVRDGKGDIYIASSAQGHLVRLLPSGEIQTLATSEAFYKLHYDEATDSVFSGDAEGDITMACLDPVSKQPYFMPVCHTEQEAVLALASEGRRLFAGTSNLAVLRAFAMQLSPKPVYISAVKDGGRTSQWSRMRLFGSFNEQSPFIGNRVKIETRSGETGRPDETWSAWQPAKYQDDSFQISTSPGRYFQYRMSWLPSAEKIQADKLDKLTIGRIDTIYMPRDTAPQISTISIKSGAALSGKQDISVTGTDADGDNLLCAIDISADGGATWKTLKGDLRAKTSKKESSKDTSSDADSSKDSEKSSDKDADKDSKKEPDNKPDKEPAAGSKTIPLQGSNSDTGAPKEKDAGDSADAGKDKDKSQPADSGKDAQKEEDKDSGRAAADKDESKNKDDKEKGKEANKDSDKDSDKADKGDKGDKGSVKISRKSKSSGKAGSSSSGTSSDSSSKSQAEGGSSTETFSWSFDTAKQKDGNYILKFSVDDRLSSPEDHQQNINLRSATVDNSPPEIELIDYHRQADGKLEFKVLAKDKFTPVANGIYKLDDGEPFAFSFEPGTIDGLKVKLIASDVKVEAGSHKLEVKVSDRAGNSATKTITIK